MPNLNTPRLDAETERSVDAQCLVVEMAGQSPTFNSFELPFLPWHLRAPTVAATSYDTEWRPGE